MVSISSNFTVVFIRNNHYKVDLRIKIMWIKICIILKLYPLFNIIKKYTIKLLN